MKRKITIFLASLLMTGLITGLFSGCNLNSSDESDEILALLSFIIYADSEKSVCEGRVSDTIQFFYVHTSDYTDYTLDWVTSSWQVKTNQITLENTQGIGGVQTYRGKILLLNQSASAAELQIYNQDNLKTPQATLNLDELDGNTDLDTPQDMVIANQKAYISMSAHYLTTDSENSLLVVDLTDLSAPAYIKSIPLSGDQPAYMNCNDGYVYIANLDTKDNSQSSISVLDPGSDTEVLSIASGQSPQRLGFNDSKAYTYNQGFYSLGSEKSLSVFDVYTGQASITPTTVTAFPDTDSDSVDEQPQTNGGIAFKSGKGYLMLSEGLNYPADFALYDFDLSTNIIGSTPLDSNYYFWLGSNDKYFVRMHNGDKSTDVLSTIIEDRNGNEITSLELTKDTMADQTRLILN